jgi:gliding motility-associated-like protein
MMAQQDICYGSTMRYSVDSFENLGKGSVGSTYHWSVEETNFKGVISNYLPDRTNDVMINWGNTSPGTYTLIVNEIDETGCISLSQTLKIDILALPPSYLSKQFVCINPLTKEIVSPAVLDTKLNESDYSFNWKFNGNPISTTSRIEAFELGSYFVEINDLKTGCKVNYEVNVELSSSSISKIKTDSFFEDKQTIVISVINGIGNYEYSIDGINFQESPNFYVSKGGIYYVSVRDKNGCSDEVLQVQIVTFPKLFTPNNDGYNDVWKIEGLTPQMNTKISILDRYGKTIKVIHLDDSGWDGSFNGFNLPADDYWFIIEYIDSKGISVIFKSHFALMR